MTFKEKAEKNKVKNFKKDIKRFKKVCIKEFRYNIRQGESETVIPFGFCSKEFRIAVYSQLRDKYEDEIRFSFIWKRDIINVACLKMEVI